MDPIVRGAALSLCLLSVGLGVFQIRDSLVQRRVNWISEQEPMAMLGKSSELISELASSRGLSGETFWRAAKATHAVVDFETDLNKKIDLVCNELQILQRAVAVEPNNSRYLVSWANVRQLLGDRVCPEVGGRAAEYKSAIERAASLDPNNPAVLYSAGLIYLWDADGNNARGMFRRYLLAGGNPSESQISAIQSSISSAEELNAVIPPRFPQIMQWSEVLKAKFPNDPKILNALSELQSTAQALSKKELLDGAISTPIFRDRLVQLRFIAASDAVRRTVDSELGDLYVKGLDKRLGLLFTRLSELSEISLVRGISAGDSRPNRGSLVEWGSDALVEFDTKYQSVGAFIPNNRRPRIILLAGAPGVPARDPSLVRVLVSSDNSAWTEVTDNSAIYAYQFEDRPLIMVDVAGISEQYPYWKVSYGSGVDDPRIVNKLSQLLRVYG